MGAVIVVLVSGGYLSEGAGASGNRTVCEIAWVGSGHPCTGLWYTSLRFGGRLRVGRFSAAVELGLG